MIFWSILKILKLGGQTGCSPMRKWLGELGNTSNLGACTALNFIKLFIKQKKN